MRGKTHCIIGILASIQTSIIFNLPLSLFTIFYSSFLSLLPDLDESNSLISNTLLNRNLSYKLYKLFILIINIVIFIVSFKINNNLFFSSITTFLSIYILSKKVNHKNTRKYLLSFLFLLLSYCLYLANFHYYTIFFSLLLSLFPWFRHRSFSHSFLGVFIIYFFLKQLEVIFNILHISIFGTISYASHIFLGDIFTKQGVPLFYPLTNKRISFAKLKVGKKLSNLLEILFVIIFTVIIITSLLIYK